MIFYDKRGEGTPVLLIHGFPNNHHSWDTIRDPLAAQFQLLLPDLPGAGASPAISDLTMDKMADSLLPIFEQESIPAAIIAGHSMGGYTALNFARRYPEKTLALSLIHSSARADSAEKRENRQKAINLIRKGEAEKLTFLKAMAGNLFGEAFTAAQPEQVQSVERFGGQLSREALIAFYEAIMNRSSEIETLKTAGFPVQWILGDEDTAVPMEDALPQVHLSPISKLNIYRPCGHMSMLEMPERLTADLLQFWSYIEELSKVRPMP